VLAAVAGAHPAPRTVILDFAAVSDVDSTGDLALAELRRTLDTGGVRLVVARATGSVRGAMRSDGVVDALGPDSVFRTVHDAVAAVSG
jgi:sulfate permease, SulP family